MSYSIYNNFLLRDHFVPGTVIMLDETMVRKTTYKKLMCCWTIHHAALSFSTYCWVRCSYQVWQQMQWKHSGGKPNQPWNVRGRCPENRTTFGSSAKISGHYWGEIGFMMKVLGEYSIPSTETGLCKSQRKRRVWCLW